MTSANEKQVGGDHYQKNEYQHWDWVCDIKLHYLLACASKYVARWRDKNGVQDLEKSTHYVDKAEERGIWAPGMKGQLTGTYDDSFIKHTRRFAGQLPGAEAAIIWALVAGEWDAARHGIQSLIAEARATESPKQEPQG